MSPNWFVYIVECADSTYYTGVSTDVHNRVRTHNMGKGAKYTRGRTPVSLVWTSTALSKRSALHFEYMIKRLRRSDKEKVVSGRLYGCLGQR